MQQFFMAGNQFQNHMWAKFNLDITSASANMSNVKGKENLVYEYVRDIACRIIRWGFTLTMILLKSIL